jgi:hypothetical protein
VDTAAVDLFASLGAPVARDIRAAVKPEGSVEIEPPANAFAGNATLIAGVGAGRLVLAWTGASGPDSRDVTLTQSESRLGETLRLLEGARKITDLESRVADNDREAGRIRERLQQLSEKYGLASREMSLVAVVKRAADVEGGVPKTVVVPVGMPQDALFGEYFAGKTAYADIASLRAIQMGPVLAVTPQSFGDTLQRFQLQKLVGFQSTRKPMTGGDTQEDLLMELAALLEPDGGMPGRTEELRIANSLATLLFFLQTGNTRASGPFRAHADRLWRFLESHGETRVLQIAAKEKVQHDWRAHAERLRKEGAVDLQVFRSDLNARYVNAS